jgi:predicted transcriptional regulator
MADAPIKEEARRLVEALPDEATWDDLMYRVYVRQAVEQGLADSEAGRVVPVEEVRARLAIRRGAADPEAGTAS